ncbi:hypothetical protein KUTeg_020540 [Tegillarca granosa]|uniref:Uncharacterized protein n=1 Tax=Tegillarca granosa TaxID=220873 RepID=A0ABQ9E867_TEGGR|nr:hypothetical protein KUTeg_020540 [Tegillarca granosa]
MVYICQLGMEDNNYYFSRSRITQQQHSNTTDGAEDIIYTNRLKHATQRNQHNYYHNNNQRTDSFNFPRSQRVENPSSLNDHFERKLQERKRGSRNIAKKLFHQDLLGINFQDLDESDSFKHLKCGFADEEDFEDFKQDLIEIRRLKKEFNEDFDPRLKRNIFADFDIIKSRRKLSKTANNRRSRVNSGDSFMEFFNTDEHFKEFDRVFETFKSKRFSNSLDKVKWSLNKYGDNDDDDDEEDYSQNNKSRFETNDDDVDDPFDDSRCDDSFTDFFDNDEDFKEFERELQTFKLNRRSRILDRLNRNSGCDIMVELKAFCDRDPTEKYEAMSNEPRLWNSGGEWDFIFNKLKRDSQVFSDTSGTGRSITSILEDKEASYDTGFYSDVKDNQIICSNRNSTTSNDDCQFTCHQKCGPLVRLGCKCKSPTDSIAEGTDPLSAETSLSDLDSSSTLSPDGSSEPTNEKDETDSGYRSGTIPDEKLPKKPSQATLNREELRRKIAEYNALVPGADLSLKEEKGESFQGFIKVVLNLVRPICMSLGMRPPSIYQALTREHIIEQNTQTVSFYMPRDTTKCIHDQNNNFSKLLFTSSIFESFVNKKNKDTLTPFRE